MGKKERDENPYDEYEVIGQGPDVEAGEFELPDKPTDSGQRKLLKRVEFAIEKGGAVVRRVKKPAGVAAYVVGLTAGAVAGYKLGEYFYEKTHFDKNREIEKEEYPLEITDDEFDHQTWKINKATASQKIRLLVLEHPEMVERWKAIKEQAVEHRKEVIFFGATGALVVAWAVERYLKRKGEPIDKLIGFGEAVLTNTKS